MFRNGKEKKNCHYRDCEAITDNLSRIKKKINVMPKFCCKQNFQGIFELNKRIGRSLEKIFKKIFRDDLSFSTPTAFVHILTIATLISFSIISDSWAAGVEMSASECSTWNGGGNYYGKDGKCYCCQRCGPVSSCGWDDTKNIFVYTACANPYALCGGTCKFAEGGSYVCDENTGNLVFTACNPPYVLCKGQCKHINEYGAPYIRGYGCDENGNPVHTKCGDWSPAPGVTLSYKLKNGRCTSDSCGNGYVEGDHICHKIPTGCDSVSASDGSCTKCSAGLAFDDDDNCIECNKKGYKNVSGYCNRIQYTPAEAAAILHDDNTNSVTITFKK